MSRADKIEAELRRLVTGLKCVPVAPSRQDWASYALPEQYRFGWLPPIPLDDGPRAEGYAVAFCPEVLDAITAGLDEAQLDCYLGVLATFVCYQLQYPEEPFDAAYRRAEDDMSLEPGARAALALFVSVNLDALDDELA